MSKGFWVFLAAALLMLFIGAVAMGAPTTDIVTATPAYIVDPITWLWPKETNTVTISCLVDANGKAKRIVKSDVSSLLLPAFERAKDHWRFTPAMRNGRPVESIVTVRFTYILMPQGYQCSASVNDIGR